MCGGAILQRPEEVDGTGRQGAGGLISHALMCGGTCVAATHAMPCAPLRPVGGGRERLGEHSQHCVTRVVLGFGTAAVLGWWYRGNGPSGGAGCHQLGHALNSFGAMRAQRLSLTLL